MIKKDGYQFFKSKRKNKKYDVYIDGQYITSFGDKNFQQYKDKIGLYSHLDHLDPKRRANYRKRHVHDNINDDSYAGFYSWHYLW